MTAIAGKTDVAENALLLLLFNNTPITLVGDAAGILGSVTAGSLYLSLHTADPTEEGNQQNSEIAYTGYARAAVPRAAGGFTVALSTVTLTAAVPFPPGTGGTGTATHFGVGTSSTGAGKLLYAGAIAVPIVCGNTITPSLGTGTSITEG